MENNPTPLKVILPQWLDCYIFGHKKAKYCRSLSDMTVIDWSKSDVLAYLGTYFPRSYAEAYCLFKHYFLINRAGWGKKTNISVFDFGCGTGGELIGLLSVLGEELPNIASVTINALDGNTYSLRICEDIVDEFQKRSHMRIELMPFSLTIEDLYDLNIMGDVVTDGYDIVLSFKTLCEFITKARFGDKNAYEQFLRVFIPKIKPDGMIMIVDVTTLNKQANEWLPRIMDRGINALSEELYIERNPGFNETFTISHSRHTEDKSKIAWRIVSTK